jgi:hypothetical protein
MASDGELPEVAVILREDRLRLRNDGHVPRTDAYADAVAPCRRRVPKISDAASISG